MGDNSKPDISASSILEISFETKDLRDLCEDELLATQSLGPAVAEALKRRLADIRAADSIHDVLAGHPEVGRYKNFDCYRFELAGGQRLTVIGNHVTPRANAVGAADWERVRRVRVMPLEK